MMMIMIASRQSARQTIQRARSNSHLGCATSSACVRVSFGLFGGICWPPPSAHVSKAINSAQLTPHTRLTARHAGPRNKQKNNARSPQTLFRETSSAPQLKFKFSVRRPRAAAAAAHTMVAFVCVCTIEHRVQPPQMSFNQRGAACACACVRCLCVDHFVLRAPRFSCDANGKQMPPPPPPVSRERKSPSASAHRG